MVLVTVLFTGAALLTTYCLYVFWTSPLKSFPGHWSTNFSNLWRFFDSLSRRPQWTQIKLHEQYGTAVRMGPNIVSISDPAVISEVFRTRNPWKKTAFYSVNDVLVNGQRISNMFGTLNEEWHTTVGRPIKNLYSMTKALDGEIHIDTMTKKFLRTLDQKFASNGTPCDMGKWIPYFAWDSMGQQTLSKPYGCLDAGSDINGLVDISTKGLEYFGAISQIPELDFLLDKNPIKRIGPPSFGWATVAAYQALGERQASRSADTKTTRESDYLDKFLEAAKEYPDLVNNDLIVIYLLSNVLAGSDTTSIYINAAIYHILKTPGVKAKLQADIDSAGTDRDEPVSWKDVQRMPFLDAVMKEAERIHPSAGLMLERTVPAEGFTLPDGRFLTAGTVVGMNPWVVNRNKGVFGADANDFKPERWLRAQGESQDTYAARTRKMQNGMLTFGAGKRACLGKNIAVLTAYKIVATLFNKYEISLADPNKEWTVRNNWFVYTYDIEVVLKARS